MGGSVAGALRRETSGPINKEPISKGPIDLGAVTVTDAYELDAEHVIHAAAMPHYGDRAERSAASSRTKSGDIRASAESIHKATRNSLERAEELECESVVIPVLRTGAAGFSFEDGGYLRL